MKKIVFIIPVLFALNSFSQNLIQQNVNFSNQRFVQAQSQQVFVSNIKMNDNPINKPVRANANPQAYVQRVSTANTTQRRRRVRNNLSTNISNPIQTNIINVSENNINDDVQLQGNFVNQMDNNVGNSFGNEMNMIEQLASVEIPAIQLGNGLLNLNLDINLPKLNFKPIKFSSRKSVSSTKHKSHQFKNKLCKLNRKLSGKLSFKKKLKIKVDNCFKW